MRVSFERYIATSAYMYECTYVFPRNLFISKLPEITIRNNFTAYLSTYSAESFKKRQKSFMSFLSMQKTFWVCTIKLSEFYIGDNASYKRNTGHLSWECELNAKRFVRWQCLGNFSSGNPWASYLLRDKYQGTMWWRSWRRDKVRLRPIF